MSGKKARAAARTCEQCGARVHNQNPRVTICSFCHDNRAEEERRAQEADYWRDYNATHIAGGMRVRFDLDGYEGGGRRE